MGELTLDQLFFHAAGGRLGAVPNTDTQLLSMWLRNAHPGGGITCGPGRLAALEILRNKAMSNDYDAHRHRSRAQRSGCGHLPRPRRSAGARARTQGRDIGGVAVTEELIPGFRFSVVFGCRCPAMWRPRSRLT